MKKFILLLSIYFFSFTSYSQYVMRQACQVTNHDLSPQGIDSLGERPKTALPGVIVIEQLNPKTYPADRLIDYVDYEPDSESNPHKTPWVPVRVSFYMQESFGLDIYSYEEKVNALLKNPSVNSKTVRIHENSLMMRYQDRTFVSLDGTLDSEKNKLVWGGGENSGSKYDFLNNGETDFRFLICGPRYKYEISEAQSNFDQAYLTDGREIAN